MTWLNWAVDDPAPVDHAGYGSFNVPRELVGRSARRGLVIHSVEGWFTYANPGAVMLARGNSWGVTIMRSGQVWRHRPRPTFVNWHAGGPAQNIGTDGIEMEGKDQPWTPEQRVSLVRVLTETQEWFGWPTYMVGGLTARGQEAIRQVLLALGYGVLWEHNWFDYTSCPSGRDDWGWLMPALAEEDDMLTVEDKEYFDAKFARLEKRQNEHGGVRDDAHSKLERRQNEHGTVRDKAHEAIMAKLDALDLSGGGLTSEEIVEAVKQASREGSG